MATGRLVLCPTPIGNLRDITLRALDELQAADVVLAEDTRRTALLLRHHGLRCPMLSYHEHNEDDRLAEVRRLLAEGRRIVAVSDAGTPSVADPGYRLVRAALESGAEVTALPGPSALLPALTLSGLPVHAFAFYGFLPRTAAGRDAAVREALERPLTAVWYESPRRLAPSLQAICALGFDRRLAAVARELTKVHEEIIRGSVADLADRFGEQPARGEIVLCIGPEMGSPSEEEGPTASAVQEVLRLCAEGAPLAAAVARVSAARRLSRRALYAATLASRQEE